MGGVGMGCGVGWGGGKGRPNDGMCSVHWGCTVRCGCLCTAAEPAVVPALLFVKYGGVRRSAACGKRALAAALHAAGPSASAIQPTSFCPLPRRLQTAPPPFYTPTFWSAAASTPSWSAGCWTEGPTRQPRCSAPAAARPARARCLARPAGEAPVLRAAAARLCRRSGCSCTSCSASCASAGSCRSCTPRQAAGRSRGCCAAPPTVYSACWRRARRRRGHLTPAVPSRRLPPPCSHATGLRCEPLRCSRQSGR